RRKGRAWSLAPTSFALPSVAAPVGSGREGKGTGTDCRAPPGAAKPGARPAELAQSRRRRGATSAQFSSILLLLRGLERRHSGCFHRASMGPKPSLPCASPPFRRRRLRVAAGIGALLIPV